MKPSTKLILGCITAVILGFAVATPILLQGLALTTKIQIKVDVAYAHLAVQNFDKNTTGLWVNSSDPSEANLHFISFLVVLNVSNLSDKIGSIEDFEVVIAQGIQVQNTSGAGGISVSESNLIVMRDLRGYHNGWSQYWSPSSSRLIALSGISEIEGTETYSALQSGTIYLFGLIQGQPYAGGSRSTEYNLKQVQLEAFGGEFLYNSLVSNNQRLMIDSNGIDAYIVTRG